MKLHGFTMSPFVARVRIALELKGCEYEMVAPLDGRPSSEAFRKLNPVGKIPLLETADGIFVAESETIIDYLDDVVSEPALLPSDPATRVKARSAVRVLESYAVPALFRLFVQLELQKRDAGIVEAEWRALERGLALLVNFIGQEGMAAGDQVSKADCILVPTFTLVRIIADILAKPDPIAAHPILADYEARALAHPVIGAVMAQTRAALAEVA